MSGTAVIGGGDATIGLVPRYLRPRQSTAKPAWAPGNDATDEAALPEFAAESLPAMGGSGVPSVTEEMRQRIAEAAEPAPRRIAPLWLGLAVVAVVGAAIVMFPGTVMAFLPSVDPSL